MSEPTEPPRRDEIVSRVQRLNAIAQGIAAGFVLGFGTFAATAFLLLKGGEVVGPHLSLLSQFYPGYRVTWLGACIGFVYSFALGFALGTATSFVYNRIVSLKSGT